MQINKETIVEWLDKLLEGLQKNKIIELGEKDWGYGFNSGLDQAIDKIGRLKSDLERIK